MSKMQFKPIPTPQTGQSRNEYIYGVCVPFLREEGYGRSQAVAICNERWRNRGKNKSLQREWSTVDRQRASFRKKFRPVIADALDEHVEQMLSIIDNTSDINNIPQYVQDKNLKSGMIRDAFEKLYIEVGSEFGKFYRRQAKKDCGLIYSTKEDEDEISNELIIQAMRSFVQDNIGQKIVSVSDTSKEIVIHKLKEIIPEILEEGLSGSEAQTKLRDRIDNEWLRFKRYRTERIVRTETTPASMKGAIKGVETTGIRHNKIWVAAFDETRDWHADANGQEVSQDAYFTVKGEQMEYPGDTSGSASNVCNCNCSLNFRVEGR